MWLDFQQVAGPGQSPASRHFAIASRDEAGAYLDHPVLGVRLRECVELVQASGTSATELSLGPSTR